MPRLMRLAMPTVHAAPAVRLDVWDGTGVSREPPFGDDAPATSGAAQSSTSDAYPKLRLLVVGPLPPPVGGVETVTQAVLESSCFTDFDVAHCDLTKGRPKSTQGKFDLGNLRWALIHFARMRRSLREFRPDVVYMPLTSTWSAFLRNAYLAKQSKRAGAKLVGHVHGGWFDRLIERQGWRGVIVQRSLGLFDALLVLGERWRKSIEGYGYPGNGACRAIHVQM